MQPHHGYLTLDGERRRKGNGSGYSISWFIFLPFSCTAEETFPESSRVTDKPGGGIAQLVGRRSSFHTGLPQVNLKLVKKERAEYIQSRQSTYQKLRSNKLSIKKTNPPCYQFDFAQWDLQEKVMFERALCRVNHANSGGKEPEIHMESRLIFKKATRLRGLRFPLRKPWFYQVGKDEQR